MTDVPDELVPPNTKTVGATNAVPEGAHGEDDVTVQYPDGREQTFTAELKISRPHLIDIVRVRGVPRRVSVAEPGLTVKLDADSIASGVYIWDAESPSEESPRCVNFVQIVPCSACGRNIAENGRKTGIGVLCGPCAWDAGVWDEDGGSDD